MDIVPVTAANLSLLDTLFCSDASARHCRCMWFIIRVKDFHAGGEAANAGKLRVLAKASPFPLGVAALHDGEAVGWVAAGPRSRYARAISMPTLKGIDHAEDDDVWLVPCFFVRADMRQQKIVSRLLAGAVDLARSHGASAVEGFPATGKTPPRSDPQVGVESTFESCGFRAVRRPSTKRVVMRLDL
jgi:hypothetical protein